MVVINALGDNCPIPVIKTKKAIEALNEPGRLEVLVDNEVAVNNVAKLAESMGHQVAFEKAGESEFKVMIEVTAEAFAAETADLPVQAAGDEVCCDAGKHGSSVVVIASDRMGDGNQELGKVLMKGFIFAVSQLEELPETMLFYNGGATLTAEGSDSLEDLKSLANQGVEILTCGTCLNYYELTDKLLVGSVTNMYTIVEKMAEAGKIIRP